MPEGGEVAAFEIAYYKKVPYLEYHDWVVTPLGIYSREMEADLLQAKTNSEEWEKHRPSGELRSKLWRIQEDYIHNCFVEEEEEEDE